jgi:hypothetical protein
MDALDGHAQTASLEDAGKKEDMPFFEGLPTDERLPGDIGERHVLIAVPGITTDIRPVPGFLLAVDQLSDFFLQSCHAGYLGKRVESTAATPLRSFALGRILLLKIMVVTVTVTKTVTNAVLNNTSHFWPLGTNPP